MVVLLGLLAGGGAVVPVGAQDVQVPFDRDSTLYSVDPDLRRQLDLFPDVDGFQGAELYRVDGSTYELVIRYRPDGRIRRERRSLSAADVRALRDRIDRAYATARPSQELGDGRYGLIAATTVHGFVEAGLLAGALGPDDADERLFTLPLLGGALGFFGPLLATQKARVTEAEADMAFYGGTQGYVHAVQLTGLVGGDQIGPRGAAGLAALMGGVEGTLAYRTARTRNWTGGHAEMVSVTGLGGNLVGLGIGTALVGEEGDRSRVVAGTSLLGSVAGAYLGHRMGRTDRYTEGDARIYLQSAVQGVNLMGSFLTLGTDVGARPTSLLLTGSAVGGAVLGRRLVRDRDFTGTQSFLVGLGSLTGSLGGLALTSDIGDGSVRAIAQGLASALGFGVTYAILEGDARRQAAPVTSGVDLHMRVSPIRAAQQKPLMNGTEALVPQVTVRATF